MAVKSHRPAMPYSFRVVNATYVNAYAFPGGSIAATRGILLSLENEAELAGLLGHEIGHVNARHTALRMTKNMLFGAVVALGTIAVSTKNEKAAPWVAGLGSLGAGLLLAHYSREDEHQADDLGMDYMTRVDHNPKGMVGLMDMLKSLSNRKPNAIEMMFSTHPMSEERYQIAVESSDTKYVSFADRPLNRDRYMDHTAGIRKLGPAIEAMQEGESAMAQENYKEAETHFKNALGTAPEDYTALMLMAKCQISMDKAVEAEFYTMSARDAYPQEAQAHYIGGIAKLMQDKYSSAHEQFAQYETILPGNPNTTFLKGFCQEGMQHIREAATEYNSYLQVVNEGEQAEHAYQRLVEWGYITP
jgi:predicted Zn-dependent protease